MKIGILLSGRDECEAVADACVFGKLDGRIIGLGGGLEDWPAKREFEGVAIKPGQAVVDIRFFVEFEFWGESEAAAFGGVIERMGRLPDDDWDYARVHSVREYFVLRFFGTVGLGVELIDDDDVGAEGVEVLNEAREEDARVAGVGENVGRLGFGIDIDDGDGRAGRDAKSPSGDGGVEFAGEASLTDLLKVTGFALPEVIAHVLKFGRSEQKHDEEEREDDPVVTEFL